MRGRTRRRFRKSAIATTEQKAEALAAPLGPILELDRACGTIGGNRHEREGDTVGTYLNPGKQGFEEAVRSEIYVDKTEMITVLNSLLNTRQKYVSVSRPRRFGKTTAVDMMCAYYGRTAHAHALFEGTRLAESAPVSAPGGKLAWDAYLGAFDVIRLAMTDFVKRDKSVAEGLARMQNLVVRDIKRASRPLSARFVDGTTPTGSSTTGATSCWWR